MEGHACLPRCYRTGRTDLLQDPVNLNTSVFFWTTEVSVGQYRPVVTHAHEVIQDKWYRDLNSEVQYELQRETLRLTAGVKIVRFCELEEVYEWNTWKRMSSAK